MCDGAYVGEEAELLSHGEQSLFRAHFCRWVVVEFGVSDRSEEYGVSFFADFECLFGEGVAHLVDGVCSAESFGVCDFVSKFLCDGREDGNALFHDFGSDAVAGENSNFQFNSFMFVMFLRFSLRFDTAVCY